VTHQPRMKIDVVRADVEQFLSRFTVTVALDDDPASFTVTLSGADWERLGRGYRAPEDLVAATFRFLLERESLGEILPSFDLSQVARFFPEYEFEIAAASGG
jgi:hypothetical protein